MPCACASSAMALRLLSTILSGAPREVLVEPPHVGDRIAEEDDSGLVRLRRRELRAGFRVARHVVAVGIAQLSLLALEQVAEVRLGALEHLAQLGELARGLRGERFRPGDGVGQGQIGSHVGEEGVGHTGVLAAERPQGNDGLARVLDDGCARAGQLRGNQRRRFHQLHRAPVEVEGVLIGERPDLLGRQRRHEQKGAGGHRDPLPLRSQFLPPFSSWSVTVPT